MKPYIPKTTIKRQSLAEPPFTIDNTLVDDTTALVDDTVALSGGQLTTLGGLRVKTMVTKVVSIIRRYR